jgi:hypothetical protein
MHENYIEVSEIINFPHPDERGLPYALFSECYKARLSTTHEIKPGDPRPWYRNGKPRFRMTGEYDLPEEELTLKDLLAQIEELKAELTEVKKARECQLLLDDSSALLPRALLPGVLVPSGLVPRVAGFRQ